VLADPVESVTVTFTVVPAATVVGVPLIVAVLVVLVLRLKPVGRPVCVQVKGPVPPVEITLTEYAEFAVAPRAEPVAGVVIDTPGEMTTLVKVFVPVALLASVAVMVTVSAAFAVVGVPLTIPVEAPIVTPGNPEIDQVYVPLPPVAAAVKVAGGVG
jgi:uncharacterized membrane protein YccF (DUF307 family)